MESHQPSYISVLSFLSGRADIIFKVFVGAMLAHGEYFRLLGHVPLSRWSLSFPMALFDAFILFWKGALLRSSFRQTPFPSELGGSVGVVSRALSVPVVFAYACFWFILLNPLMSVPA